MFWPIFNDLHINSVIVYQLSLSILSKYMEESMRGRKKNDGSRLNLDYCQIASYPAVYTCKYPQPYFYYV